MRLTIKRVQVGVCLVSWFFFVVFIVFVIVWNGGIYIKNYWASYHNKTILQVRLDYAKCNSFLFFLFLV